ncbi:MAG: hypothetical protein M3067_09150 [Chloroflexota bacterium]|nr:hypothetical protein [Chloroflexota bacterium]
MKLLKHRHAAVAICALAVVGAAFAAVAANAAARGTSARPLLRSALALDAEAETITLPLHKGVTESGAATWYVVVDSSGRADAAHRGVNFAPRLRNALGTKAVQRAKLRGGKLVFAGTVDFSPKRVVVPSATGFPPTKVAPGALGDKRYSPLVTTDGRIVLDAPQVANASGRSDSVTKLDTSHRRVTLKLLRGWFSGTSVLYVRTDASAEIVAALEGSTYAPNLGAAPGLGSNASTSARSAIIPVINGAQSGPDRQGLQSAVLGGGDPLNITQSLPGGSDYTPVWDLHPVLWTDQAIKDGKRVQLKSAAQVARDVKAGLLTSAGKGPANSSLGGLRAIGFISICSTVAVG